MRVLVGCEFSGRVREAFRARGHDAWSADLIDTEIPGKHITGDVRDVIASGRPWDMLIVFPPCTFLARSGARWHNGTDGQRKALVLVSELLASPIERIALENPSGAISRIRKPDQVIHPWWFGDPVSKQTCLWLKGLPPLIPVNPVAPDWRSPILACPPSPDRWKDRSRTYPGIASAMADQWG